MKSASCFILIGLAGCVDLKAAYPERRFYMIDAGRTGTERSGDEKTVLRVQRLAASKMCDRSELVGRTGETTYDSDFYNVLFVPPARQVGELTERWLQGSGLYGSVIGPGNILIETHVLEGNLIALYGDSRKSDDVLAVIELQFMLMRVSSDPVLVMLQKSYREEIPIAKGDPASLVQGWGKGLRKILTALEEDMAKAPPEAR